MQFKIDIQVVGSGWEVHVLDPATGQPIQDPATGQPLTAPPRALPCSGPSPSRRSSFPLPPGTNPATGIPGLHSLHQSIVTRHPGANGMERFGRYLFDTLLGDKLWEGIKAAAGKQPVELALSWRTKDAAMNRLPWEMMYAGKDFLAAESKVAITRRVIGVNWPVPAIESPPRVLFVAGSSLNNAAIRAGAEYLGLLRDLEWKGLSLKTHLLTEATTVKLEKT